MNKNIFFAFLKKKRLSKGRGEVFIIVGVGLIAFFLTAGGADVSKRSKQDASYPLMNQEVIFSEDEVKDNLQLKTFTVKSTCGQTLAINFLIDVSGSMRFENKQVKEKEALKIFTSRMDDASVVGIQTFSTQVRERVPISFYKDVKAQVQQTISRLSPFGATYTKDGFLLAKDRLSKAIRDDRFKDYKFALIFISDGVPEDTGNKNSQNCHVIVPGPGGLPRCFSKVQDPRIPTNIAQEIKDLGIEIYSVAITSNEPSDKALQPYLEKLMQDVASQPLSQYYHLSPSGDNLKTIFNTIQGDLCKA